MGSETVFGHLALRFAVHPENLATEALTFILQTSDVASIAFTELLRDLGLRDLGTLNFSSQVGGLESSVPDMKCVDENGWVRVLVENKFWAGLTDNQPVTYLRELPSEKKSLVLLVVPAKRLAFVWDEVIDRCNAAGLTVDLIECSANDRLGEVAGGKRIAAISWAALLEVLGTATSSALDAKAQSNIAQLRGLCLRMDAEAFIPLRADELTDLETVRRFISLSNLPFEIVATGSRDGWCSRKRESAFRYGAGTYIEIGGVIAWLGLATNLWNEYSVSPIWLNFYPEYCQPLEIGRRLSALKSQRPQRCFEVQQPGYRFVAVPIFLLAGVEMQRIIEDASRQLSEVRMELLKESI